jgi:putative Mn2+ efflux pump MntP
VDYLALVLIAVGLAMDAFAVSICKGLAIGKPTLKTVVIIALWFGVFQGLMPIIGFLLGTAVYDLITDYDHWAAFILLALIGANMIRESLSREDEEVDDDLSFMTMLLLAIATSIDALAVGISLALDDGNIYVSALAIGVITFLISAVGVGAGSTLGSRYGRRAEFVGGIILILIGLKILLEHTGFL